MNKLEDRVKVLEEKVDFLLTTMVKLDGILGLVMKSMTDLVNDQKNKKYIQIDMDCRTRLLTQKFPEPVHFICPDGIITREEVTYITLEKIGRF